MGQQTLHKGDNKTSTNKASTTRIAKLFTTRTTNSSRKGTTNPSTKKGHKTLQL
jgi:hypothetical protein